MSPTRSSTQPLRAKPTTGEFLRFVLVGFVNTGLTYVLFAILSSFIHYSISYTIVFVLGIFIFYFLNTRFVFGEKPHLRTLFAYPLVYIVQYVIGLVLLGLLVDQLKINRLIASPLVIIATLPITFVASRFIIRQRPVS